MRRLLPKLHLLINRSPLPVRHTRLALLDSYRVFSSNSSLPEPHETPSAVPPSQSSESLSNDANSVILEEQNKRHVKHRRIRIFSSPSNGKEQEPLELPDDLDILWLPTDSGVTSAATSDILPGPYELKEALNSLLITLHPKNQHRALYPGSSCQPVEPTLGLYCPLEGGDCVVDATVRELASRTGSEVLVLDAVQLAAGEWGAFGKAASAFGLLKNTLDSSSQLLPSVESSRQTSSVVEEKEEGQPTFILSAALKTMPSLQGRGAVVIPSRRTAAPPSKLEMFFETIVNLPSVSEGSDDALKDRPRLIYIRDFPTLAPSFSVWYPPLLAAVRNRRKGLISRPSSVVASPSTIIFGMSSPITPPYNSPGYTSSIFMTHDTSSKVAEPEESENADEWNESKVAKRARYERMTANFKMWEKDTSMIFDEYPTLPPKQESSNSSPFKPEIVIFDRPNGQSILPSLGMPKRFGSREPDGDKFFRFFTFAPASPSASISQLCDARISRRREINELIIRMKIGSMGGVLESRPAELALTNVKLGSETQPSSPLSIMWETWGNEIQTSRCIRKVADSAIGSVMTLNHLSGKEVTLEPTLVPWTSLQTAWAALRNTHEKNVVEQEDSSKAKLGNDKVVESVKNDSNLDPHEHRLISCIVDPNSISTSFKQVHLPPHTIDSVRTIVSLPLLHPYAFQQGILKDYTMTGCLLFGPPGTGKTLVVRALAKEAGCRMLAISPSDIIDMYAGEGEKLVKAVFSLARRLSPCVVFLDEIDAFFGVRTSTRETGDAFAYRGVITEFMQEIDGLKSSKDNNVIVIGATNRPFDLDGAVLRRLPRRLLVDLPGEQERREILRILLRDESLAEDVTIEALAAKTDSFSGSDLKHLCVSAALDSVKEHLDLPWKTERLTASPLSEPLNATAAAIDGDSFLSTPLPETSSAPIKGESTPSIISSLQQHLDENLPKDDLLSSTLPKLITPDEATDNKASLSITISSPQLPLDNVSNDDSPPSSFLGLQETPRHPTRVMHLRNFLQALREISPSSSESFGSLANLRKWNEEFGEGRKDRRKRQVWGRGQFGFVEQGSDTFQEGRVIHSQPKL